MTMTKRTPDDAQIAIGVRVRIARRARNMSQSDLGKVLGVTFQQVQKYENGTNRFSAGQLSAIASALQMPIAYFYEDIAPPPSDAVPDFKETYNAFLLDPAGYRMARAFNLLPERVRRATVEIVESVARIEPETGV